MVHGKLSFFVPFFYGGDCVILSGLEIKKRLGKEIVIEPYNEQFLNPNSYNLRLHNELLTYEDAVLDIEKANF